MATEPIYKQIGRIVRARRRVLDKAQDDLARDMGMSRATLANIETGRQRILVHQLYAFAKALDLKLNELLPAQLPVSATVQWSGAPIEGDLNSEQKNQIVGLIERIETQSQKRMEGLDGKHSARASRNTGAKTT